MIRYHGVVIQVTAVSVRSSFSLIRLFASRPSWLGPESFVVKSRKAQKLVGPKPGLTAGLHRCERRSLGESVLTRFPGTCGPMDRLLGA